MLKYKTYIIYIIFTTRKMLFKDQFLATKWNGY